MAIIDYFSPSIFGSELIEGRLLLIFANRIALFTLLINGTLISAKRFTILKLAFCLIIVGAAFKILHLPTADYLLAIALSSIAVIYISWFYSKQQRTMLDILKVLSVTLIAAPLELFIYNELYADVFVLAGEFLCASTFLFFVYAQRERYLGSAR